MLNITCPACKSRNVRSSLSRNFAERVAKAFGFFQIRCKECNTRFTRQIWDIRNAFYARCPRCYRLDLSTWSLDYYRAPMRWRFYLKIGAACRRCEYCRHNWVTFRPCKIRYERPRKSQPAGGTDADDAQLSKF